MAIATKTRAQVKAAKDAVYKLNIALRQIDDGSGTPARPGRYTTAQVDALITAAKTAIDVINAA